MTLHKMVKIYMYQLRKNIQKNREGVQYYKAHSSYFQSTAVYIMK